MENIREIEGFDDYYISDKGNVYSKKTGVLKKLSPFIDGRGLYYLIKLKNNDGKYKALLVHRLVAIAFIPNPNNLPEVNHKNKNTQDNDVSNLEWMTRKENLYDSYTTMSPVRNKNMCKLYYNDVLIGNFESIKSACEYASEKFGISSSSLEKYLKSGLAYIEPQIKNRKNIFNRQGSDLSTNNLRNCPIYIKRNDLLIKVCKTVPEVIDYFKYSLGINISSRIVESHYRSLKPWNGYTFIRELNKV